MSEHQYRNTLAIDTATMHLRLALSFGGDRQVKSDNLMERSHGQVLIKKIDELFQSAGLDQQALEALVVCLGPGSFTGLRIGLAGAKGLAVALGIPIVGVHLFDLAAYKLRSFSEPVVLLLPHRRDEFFIATIEQGVCNLTDIGTISASTVQEAVSGKKVRLIGFNEDLFPLEPDAMTMVQVLEYDATDLLHLGLKRLIGEGPDDIASLEPMYLQSSQAEIRFEERR